jgi:ATP-binding cassette subfamily B protein
MGGLTMNVNKDGIFKIISSKYMRGYFNKYKWNYFFGLAIIGIIDVLQLRIPLLIGRVIDNIGESNLVESDLSEYVKQLLFLGIIITVGRFGWRMFIFRSSRNIEYDVRNDLFRHLEFLSQRYYNKNKTGDIMAHLTNDLNALRMAVGPGVLMTFDASVLGILTIYNMSTQINPRLTFFAVLPLSLIIIVTAFLAKIMFRRYKEKQEAFTGLSDFTQENFSGINVVKAFVQETKEIEAFSDVNSNTFNKNIRMLIINSLLHPIMAFITGLSLTVVLGYGGYLATINIITIGQLSAFIQFIVMLIWPMIAIGYTINLFSMGAASLTRIEEILNEDIEIKDSESVKDIKKTGGFIEIKNLTFSYPQSDFSDLNDINLDIANGKTLGILGRTGSGKSTLVNLLLRLYDSPRNSIFIDGTDILDIPLHTLRKSIGYVPQDSFLFSTTISKNIDFGVRNSPIKNIVDSAKYACVHDNIMEFSQQYDTVIGERGVSLSGGQKQRISIARGLIKDPPILILDDSLSAVDTETENNILSHLNIVRKNKTNILISHRISTLQNSDHIIVLDKGAIVERGSHEELILNDGLYNQIYKKQLLEKAIDDTEVSEVIL